MTRPIAPGSPTFHINVCLVFGHALMKFQPINPSNIESFVWYDRGMTNMDRHDKSRKNYNLSRFVMEVPRRADREPRIFGTNLITILKIKDANF